MKNDDIYLYKYICFKKKLYLNINFLPYKVYINDLLNKKSIKTMIQEFNTKFNINGTKNTITAEIILVPIFFIPSLLSGLIIWTVKILFR